MRRGVPHLMIVDDAHWLDDAGQHLVEHLAFRLGTAAVTGQSTRVCLLLVARDQASSRLMHRLIDEPITRRMTLGTLDDREARELATHITPGITDRRTIARLVELSGGNPLTLNALADSISVGELLPPPSSTTGTIPVEVAWRARLSTLSPEAFRTAVVIALAEQTVQHRGADDVEVLAGAEAAVDELQSMGAVQRQSRRCGVHASTTANDHARSRRARARRRGGRSRCSINSTARRGWHHERRHPGSPVRCCTANRRRASSRPVCSWRTTRPSFTAPGRPLVTSPSNWSRRPSTLPQRAHWMHRLGTARFNELDRDEATQRLIEAADLYESCVDGATVDEAARYQEWPRRMPAAGHARRLHSQRTAPSRRPRRARRATLIGDESVDRHWRSRSAAILVEASFTAPQHDRRRQLVETAQTLAAGRSRSRSPRTWCILRRVCTAWRCSISPGQHNRSRSRTRRAARWSDPWWRGGDLARRGLVALVAGDPMARDQRRQPGSGVLRSGVELG